MNNFKEIDRLLTLCKRMDLLPETVEIDSYKPDRVRLYGLAIVDEEKYHNSGHHLCTNRMTASEICYFLRGILYAQEIKDNYENK